MAQKPLYEEVIIAGFGGQGIILAGKLLAQTAMACGKEVTYMPSYGAEVRGGTANCMVVIAERPIASPVVTRPDALVAMNKASLNKFGPRVKPGGIIILNAARIEESPKIDSSVTILAMPADELAEKVGSLKSANMVAIGAYLAKRDILSLDSAAAALADVLAKRLHKTIPLNAEAIKRGGQFVRDDR